MLPWFFPHVLNIFPPLAVRTGSSKFKSPLRVISARRKTCNQLQLANSVGTENEEKNAPSFVGDDICLICLIMPHHILIICLLEFQPLESFGSILFRRLFLLSPVKQLALASFPPSRFRVSSEPFRVRLTHEVNRKFSNLTDGTKFAQDLVTESQNSEVQTDMCAKMCQVHRSCGFKRILSDIWFGWCENLKTGNWLDVTQIGGFLCGFSPREDFWSSDHLRQMLTFSGLVRIPAAFSKSDRLNPGRIGENL